MKAGKEYMMKKETMKHISEHIDYPATKKDIIKACSGMMDVPKSEKNWVEKCLPNKTFSNSDEVIDALRMGCA
jgi:hypothetical protein